MGAVGSRWRCDVRTAHPHRISAKVIERLTWTLRVVSVALFIVGDQTLTANLVWAQRVGYPMYLFAKPGAGEQSSGNRCYFARFLEAPVLQTVAGSTGQFAIERLHVVYLQAHGEVAERLKAAVC